MQQATSAPTSRLAVTVPLWSASSGNRQRPAGGVERPYGADTRRHTLLIAARAGRSVTSMIIANRPWQLVVGDLSKVIVATLATAALSADRS